MRIESTLCLNAQEIMGIQSRYAKKGVSMSELALCGANKFIAWQHYPQDDLVDKESGYFFYYHSHSSDEMSQNEHGHFHLFWRDPASSQEFHHLIAIALDSKGLPVRLFTTNQWVTGEFFIKANAVLQALKHFDISTKGRMSPLARWINALTKIFYVEMEMLIVGRDRKLKIIESELGSLEAAFSAKQFHVLTECKIDLMDRLSEHLTLVH
jgi:hypothetical protein